MQLRIPVSFNWGVPCHLFLPALSRQTLTGLKSFVLAKEALFSFLLDQNPPMKRELLHRLVRLGLLEPQKPSHTNVLYTSDHKS